MMRRLWLQGRRIAFPGVLPRAQDAIDQARVLPYVDGVECLEGRASHGDACSAVPLVLAGRNNAG